MPISQKTQWLICRILAGIAFIHTLTPVVIPMGESGPMLMGTPYTMWMGLVFSFLFLLLTVWGIRVYPKDNKEL